MELPVRPPLTGSKLVHRLEDMYFHNLYVANVWEAKV